MMITEMMDRLEELAEDIRSAGGDPGQVDVRLATQPSWPFESSVAGLALSTDAIAEDEGDIEHDADGGQEMVVYIAEGSQLGYTSKSIWAVAR